MKVNIVKNTIEQALHDEDLMMIVLLTGRLSRPYLQRKYSLNFIEADKLAKEVEKEASRGKAEHGQVHRKTWTIPTRAS